MPVIEKLDEILAILGKRGIPLLAELRPAWTARNMVMIPTRSNSMQIMVESESSSEGIMVRFKDIDGTLREMFFPWVDPS